MWATKDGWPVGVTHAFVWRDGKIWITFAAHRHRADGDPARQPRLRVRQQRGYPAGAAAVAAARRHHVQRTRRSCIDDQTSKRLVLPGARRRS